MIVFAVDPGTSQSGWCIFDSSTCGVVDCGVAPNCDLIVWIANEHERVQPATILAIEDMAGMGMTVGQETFTTVKWIGRFQQAWPEPEKVRMIFRHQVKAEICGNQRAKDANIRQALIDRLGEPGVKARPGPTYGVSSHAWSALAVAVTALERMGVRVQPRQGALA